MTALHEITAEFRQVASALEALEDITPATIDDTLSVYKGAVEDKIKNIARYINDQRTQIAAIKGEEIRLYNRRKAIDSRIEGLKRYTINCMRGTNIASVNDTLFSIKIRKAPAAVIVDTEGDVPAKYRVVKETISIDKKAIKDAIKNGEQVAGVHLEQKDILSIL